MREAGSRDADPLPNETLRRLRESTSSQATPGESLTRQELAELVNAHVEEATGRPGPLDANYIGKLERGMIRWPGARYRVALRTILGVETDREVGFLRPTRPRPQETAEESTTGPMVGTSIINRSPASADGCLQAHDTSLPGQLVQSMSGLPTMVARHHVAGLRATARLFTDTDHSHGGRDVAGAAVLYLDHATELLRRPCPPGLRPELFSAVGWLGHVVGFSAFDALLHREAGAAFTFALSCAEQAGDWHLRAKVLSSMAREAIWRGDADTGLTWIELALVRADRLTATERAMLFTGRARALALLGRTQDTLRAIRVADEHFRQTDPAVDPPWMAYYDLPQHLGDTGHALFDLAIHGHWVHEANRRLSAAVAGHGPLYVRARAFSELKLATLTLRCGGDPVEGAAIGRRAAETAQGVRSARAVQVLHELDAAAAPHSRYSELARLRRSINEVINAP